MKIIIIHGEKPKKSGEITQLYKERLDLGIKLAKSKKFNLIIISGGKTRKDKPSEAELGKKYIKNELKIPIILERLSKTTIENIKFSKGLVKKRKIKIQRAAIITSKKRVFKVKYLYKKIWPEIYKNLEFYGAKDSYFILFYLWEALSLLLSIIDINERTIHRLNKRLFRS